MVCIYFYCLGSQTATVKLYCTGVFVTHCSVLGKTLKGSEQKRTRDKEKKDPKSEKRNTQDFIKLKKKSWH